MTDPFVADRAGRFSTLRAPVQITVLEVAALVTQLAILPVALRLRQSPTVSPDKRD